LGALIPQGSVFVGGRTIVNIEITKIAPNPRQPRTKFSRDALISLSESIKEQGVIEPVLTRMRDGKYELIAGERRLRAAKMAGLTVIPSIVKDFSDEQSLELALIENLQREDLNAMDEAEGYARLSKEFSMTQEQIAKKVGKDRSTVANMLRLLTLPEKVTYSLRKEEIAVGHARALLAIADAEKQMEVYRQILKNNLNVRDVELLAGSQEKIQVSRKGGRRRLFTQNAELNALVERLTTHLGTKVKVFGSQERGKLEVHYYSKDDLERVVNLLTAASAPSPCCAAIPAPPPEPARSGARPLEP